MNVTPTPSIQKNFSKGEAIYPSLKGKVVFISGGATGIGEAIVRAFTRQGAKVAFVDIDIDAGTRLAAELAGESTGRQVLFKPCDVTDAVALQAVITEVAQALGAIGVLVNNAANDLRHAPDQVTPEFFDRTVAVNLRHQFFAAQAVAPGMAAAGGGSIINLGSVSWMNKNPNLSVYETCKAAVQGLTRSLARDLGKSGIRVNTLVPGWVMTEKQLKMWVTPEGEREMDAAQCLPGRVQSEDIAAMALFLAADDSRMCTAQDFIVDAGWT
jgi:D-xylose 1-dehydrogenase